MKTLIVNVSRSVKPGASGKLYRLWYHGLTLPYLAALFGRGTDVQIVEELVSPIPFDTDADLVALTTMGCGLTHALEVADRFRGLGKRVIIGGPTASAYPEVVAPHVDSLVIGDGDGLVDRLLDDLDRGALAPVYRHLELPELTNTPVPRYDLIQRDRVGLYYPVEATRGCTLSCRFCLTSQLSGRRQRQKPIADVVRDIEAIKALGIDRVMFMDDNPTADREYFRRLVEAITPLSVAWMANATLAAVPDDATADVLVRSGCEMLAVGFESVNQESLDGIGKGCFDVRQYSAFIARLHDRGIHVTAMMVVGLDHDGPESLDRMLRFLIENKVETAIFHVLTPIAGTPLHAELEAQGRMLDLDLSHYSAEEAVFRPKQMSAEELEAQFWRLYREFYSVGSIVRRQVLRWPDRSPVRRLGSIVVNLYMRHNVTRGLTPV
ncbi:MAG: B12-binding domain-containing radical SAM protein [Candidatus Riflebacteria bacterium]|nr:B12-binding domain-containing radical SAM protein [Candidatus Riflebacteria bacterium]